MSVAPQHKCRPSEDPRRPGHCACGARMPRSVRSAEYESEFLANAAEAAERRYGTPAGDFVERVRERLAKGAATYGDEDFMRKDNLRELLEETPDVAGYALLEAQKMIASGDDENETKAWHLFEAAVLAAAADYHARAARSA